MKNQDDDKLDRLIKEALNKEFSGKPDLTEDIIKDYKARNQRKLNHQRTIIMLIVAALLLVALVYKWSTYKPIINPGKVTGNTAVPDYIPDGYTRTITDHESSKQVVYQNENGDTITVDYLAQGMSTQIGIDNIYKPEPLIIDRGKHRIKIAYCPSVDHSDQVIYWGTKNVVYVIHASETVPKSTLKKLAEEIMRYE